MIIATKRSLTDGYRYLVADRDRMLVIYGALKYRGIYRHHQDFDDFVSQAMFWYAQAYVDYPGSPKTDPSSFAHYAYQRIDWHLKDYFKAQHIRQSRQGPFLDASDDFTWLVAPDSETLSLHRAETQALWRQLWPYLSPKENDYLRCVISLGLNNQAIAKRWQTSPQAVSGVRKRVIQKARAIFLAPPRTA